MVGLNLMHSNLSKQIALCMYLTRMEFDKRFAGSVGGRIWLFVGPIVTIGVIWIAMDFGLGLRATSGSRYGISLAIGLTAWLFLSEAINSSVSSIVGNSHLVKKVVFPVALLPLASVLAAFVVHLLLLAILLTFIILQGEGFSWALLMLPVWALCLLALTSGLALMAAGLNVILRDMTAIIPSSISLLFWLTPIVWPLDNIRTEWRAIALLNPVAVIIEGYRQALLGGPSTLSASNLASFALISTFLLVGSILTFRRIRPWFANVL
jgi:ABC-type polysaccharide/polyol phosphate export permease